MTQDGFALAGVLLGPSLAAAENQALDTVAADFLDFYGWRDALVAAGAAERLVARPAAQALGDDLVDAVQTQRY